MATSHDPERLPAAVHRGRFIDLLRTVAILAIVGQHWTEPVLCGDGTFLPAAGAPTLRGDWLSAWISPVLPLVFFAGGAAAAASLHTRGRETGAGPAWSWSADHAIRSAAPVLPLVVAWLLLPHPLVAAGVPEQPVHSVAGLVGRLIWFWTVYAVLTSLTPVLVRLHERCRGLEMIVMVAGAAAIEAVRLIGVDRTNWLGAANVVLVLGVVCQAGIAYSRGRFDHVRRAQMLALAAGALMASVLTLGPYALGMLAGPGEPSSSSSPPAITLLGLAAAQLGLLLGIRNAIERWASHRPVAAMLEWISVRTMTIYLWHVPALAAVAGIAAIGHDVTGRFVAGWEVEAPLRLATVTFVLACLVCASDRYERHARQYLARRRQQGWG